LVLPLFALITILQAPVFAQDQGTLFYRQCLAENKARADIILPLEQMAKNCTALQLTSGSTQTNQKLTALGEDLKKLYRQMHENMELFVPLMAVDPKLTREQKRNQEDACADDNRKIAKKNQLVTDQILSCLKNFSAPQVISNQNQSKNPRPQTVTPSDSTKTVPGSERGL
jgi:hypothetical protein